MKKLIGRKIRYEYSSLDLKGILLCVLVTSALMPTSDGIVVPSRGNRLRIGWKPLRNPSALNTLYIANACMGTFLRRQFPTGTPLALFLPPQMTPESENLLMHLIQLDLVVYLTSSLTEFGNLCTGNMTMVLLISSSGDLEEYSNSESRELEYAKCTSCIILSTHVYQSQASLDKDLSFFTDILWEGRFSSILFAVRLVKGDTYWFFKSLTFVNGTACRPAKPVLLQKCSCYGNTNCRMKEAETRLFAPMESNGCLVNVGFSQNSPYTIAPRRGGDKPSGIEPHVLEIVSAKIGFGYEIEQIDRTDDLIKRNRRMTNHSDFEFDETYDMMLGGLPLSSTSAIDHTKPYGIAITIWLLPIENQISIKGLVTPFDSLVWLALGVLLVVATLVHLLLGSDFSIFAAISVSLGVSWSRLFHRLSSRLYLISWALPGYVLAQCYLASLSGQLAYQSLHKIDSLDELVDSGFILGGPENLGKLFFDKSLVDFSDDASHSFVCNHLLSFNHSEYNLRLQELVYGINTSLALLVMLNVSSENVDFGPHAYRMRESAGAYPLTISVRSGFPFLTLTDKYIYSIVEAGLIRHWVNRPRKPELEDLSASTLGLEQLTPGFLLIPIGGILASVVLCFEFCVLFLKSRRFYPKNSKIVSEINK